MANRKKAALAHCAAGVLAAMVSMPLAAQEDSGDSVRLDEVVVTAQKREQRLQDVPIAVSVVSGDLAENTGGFNIESLRALVPSLNLRKTNTSLNQALFLRGVGTINFAIAAQPSVAAVVDGVVLSSAGEAFGDLYDVERIEVLRGPQGTLFGKNASAGVVNIVTKRPGTEFGGYIDIGLFEDDERRVKASIDAPISESLRTRTTVTWGEFDGYIDNISTTAAGGKLNGYDRKGIRTVWVADATEKVQLTFIADYRESDDNCCVEVIGARPAPGANAAAITSLLAGVDFAGDASRRVRQNLQMRSEEEAFGASVQADVDLGNLTLTSITAYRTWDATEVREGDWFDRPAAYVGNAFAQLHDFGPQTTDTISQELRIASAGGQTLDYVAGLFFSKTDAERFFRRDTIVCSGTTSPVDATGLAPCLPGTSTIVQPSANALFGADFKNLAAFADGTWNISESFRMIGGLRWTQDDLSYQHTYNFSPIAGPGIRPVPVPFVPTERRSGSNKSDNLSGRFGVQWDATDDLMTYLTYARGYKGPAYNVFFNMSANNEQVIDAETADSFEIGAKSTLFDGRMILNAAAFWAAYDDFQANNFLTLNNVVITTLTNAGKVTSGGVELEFQAQPTDNFSLSGGVAYTDARIDEFFTPPGRPPNVRNGTALPLAPLWKASLVGEWRIPVGSFELVPNIVVAYQDEQFSDLNEPAALRIPAYTTVDLSVALTDENDRFRVALIGRNITDENFVALKTAGGPGGAPRLQIPRDADRYFGIQARFNFGAN
jgi:iron complex outermembrane receptor protein